MGTRTPAEGFFAIPVEQLQTATVVAFDLYLPRASGAPVLYREKNLVFTLESRRRLEESGATELLVPQEQFGTYRSYRLDQRGVQKSEDTRSPSPAEQALPDLLSDATVPLARRAEALLGVSHQLLEAAFADLGTTGLPGRVLRVAETTARFLIDEPAAYTQLVGLLSTDFEIYAHSINSSLYAAQLAVASQITDPHEVALIARAALLHDVGKGDIPAEILHKAGELTDLEWAEVMSHVERGVARLREAGWDDPTVLDVVANHHERADGSGYPRGLTLEKTSLAAQIVALVDTFDALTSSYPSRPALSGFQALWKMKRELAAHFDPQLLDRFVSAMVDPQARRH